MPVAVYADNAPKILAGHELLFGVVKKVRGPGRSSHSFWHVDLSPTMTHGNACRVALSSTQALRSCKSAFRTVLTCLAWFVGIPVGTSWIWRYYFSQEFHFAYVSRSLMTYHQLQLG